MSSKTTMRMVPGLDGRLYVMKDTSSSSSSSSSSTGDDDNHNNEYDDEDDDGLLQPLDLTIGEVLASPVKTCRAGGGCGIVTATKTTWLFALDSTSGKLVWHTTSNNEDQDHHQDAAVQAPSSSTTSTVLLQREDVMVQQLSTTSGEKVWNVTLGTLQALEFGDRNSGEGGAPNNNNNNNALLPSMGDERDDDEDDDEDPLRTHNNNNKKTTTSARQLLLDDYNNHQQQRHTKNNNGLPSSSLPFVLFGPDGDTVTAVVQGRRTWKRHFDHVVASVFGLQDHSWKPLTVLDELDEDDDDEDVDNDNDNDQQEEPQDLDHHGDTSDTKLPQPKNNDGSPNANQQQQQQLQEQPIVPPPLLPYHGIPNTGLTVYQPSTLQSMLPPWLTTQWNKDPPPPPALPYHNIKNLPQEEQMLMLMYHQQQQQQEEMMMRMYQQQQQNHKKSTMPFYYFDEGSSSSNTLPPPTLTNKQLEQYRRQFQFHHQYHQQQYHQQWMLPAAAHPYYDAYGPSSNGFFITWPEVMAFLLLLSMVLGIVLRWLYLRKKHKWLRLLRQYLGDENFNHNHNNSLVVRRQGVPQSPPKTTTAATRATHSPTSTAAMTLLQRSHSLPDLLADVNNNDKKKIKKKKSNNNNNNNSNFYNDETVDGVLTQLFPGRSASGLINININFNTNINITNINNNSNSGTTNTHTNTNTYTTPGAEPPLLLQAPPPPPKGPATATSVALEAAATTAPAATMAVVPATAAALTHDNNNNNYNYNNTPQQGVGFLIDGIPLVQYARYQSEFAQVCSLGKGGFGTVFRCRNALDGREYAIKKVILKYDSRLPKQEFEQRLKRTLREVKSLALLDHNNIVRYYTAWLEIGQNNNNGENNHHHDNNTTTNNPSDTSYLFSSPQPTNTTHNNNDHHPFRKQQHNNNMDHSISFMDQQQQYYQQHSMMSHTNTNTTTTNWDRPLFGANNYGGRHSNNDQHSFSSHGFGGGPPMHRYVPRPMGFHDDDDDIGFTFERSASVASTTQQQEQQKQQQQQSQEEPSASTTTNNSNNNKHYAPVFHSKTNDDDIGFTFERSSSLAPTSQQEQKQQQEPSASTTTNLENNNNNNGLIVPYNAAAGGGRKLSTTSQDHHLQNIPTKHVLYIQMQFCSQKTLADFLANEEARKGPSFHHHLGSRRRSRARSNTNDTLETNNKNGDDAVVDGDDMVEEFVDIPYALSLFIQIAQGVQHVHSHGLIHRDLKPTNCFIDDAGIVKVGDFGLSRESSSNSTGSGTTTKNVLGEDDDDEQQKQENSNKLKSGDFMTEQDITAGVGTRSYASPEQMKGSDYDSSTDVYALGIMLFELCYLMRTGMERNIVLSELRSHKFPDRWLSTTRQTFPTLHELLQTMLSNNPSDRPSAEVVVSKVREILEGFTISSLDTKNHPRDGKNMLFIRVEATPKEDVLRHTIKLIEEAAAPHIVQVAQYGLKGETNKATMEFALTPSLPGQDFVPGFGDLLVQEMSRHPEILLIRQVVSTTSYS